MNMFQKNPFIKKTNTKIVGNIKIPSEKEKISNIKETMNKLKYQQKKEENIKPLTTKEKVDILKNLDRK